MTSEMIIITVVVEIMLFFVGACVMSFLDVIIDRVPKGLSPYTGRSRCDSCGHTLSVFELVPVFSWLFLGGKCKHCKAKIPYIYPVKELLGGLIYAYFGFMFGLEYFVTVKTFLYATIMFVFVCICNVTGFLYLKREKIGYGSVIAMLIPAIGMIVFDIVNRNTDEILLRGLSGFVLIALALIFSLIKGKFSLAECLFAFVSGIVLSFTKSLLAVGLAVLILAFVVILIRFVNILKKPQKIYYMSIMCLALAGASLVFLK